VPQRPIARLRGLRRRRNELLRESPRRAAKLTSRIQGLKRQRDAGGYIGIPKDEARQIRKINKRKGSAVVGRLRGKPGDWNTRKH
jgi:hypothetical protein